jgi:succinate dehydrogenase / fumarate reductase cytochrome b subunit
MAGSWVCRFFQSTLGLKVLMAATGVVLFGYTVGHVLGNLLLFAGPAKLGAPARIDAYAALLKANPGLLWGVRILLLASVVAHIAAAVRLHRIRTSARPVGYLVVTPRRSSYASRTMFWSGPILGLFVVYHLLHFTVGVVHPDHAHFDGHAVFHNVVEGFRVPVVAGVYIIAMLALGFHLSHGVWSMLQTIGVNRPNWETPLRRLSILFGVVVCGGFISIPLAVLLGFGR